MPAARTPRLTGNIDFAFSADLKPVTVKGNVRFLVNKAQGALGELASFGTDLDCEVSPSEIKQISLRFAKGGGSLEKSVSAGRWTWRRARAGLRCKSSRLTKACSTWPA